MGGAPDDWDGQGCGGGPRAAATAALSPPRARPSTVARLARGLCAAAFALAVAGCSVVGTFYERADWFALREADRWFGLDAAQEDAFRAAVGAALERHRREELPAWSALVARAAALVEGGADAPAVAALVEDGRRLLRATTLLAVPPVAQALAGLDEGQIARFERELAEDNADYAEEYLDADPAERAGRRAERAREAIERWTGALEPAQRAQVDALMASVPDGSRDWGEHRLAWQRELLAALRSGADAARLERLLAEWWAGSAGMEPDDLERLAQNRAIVASGLAGLFATLSPAQRERAARRLNGLAGELAALHREAVPEGEAELAAAAGQAAAAGSPGTRP